MSFRLEHANFCVDDIDLMIQFLRAAFPECRIRRDVVDDDGSRWVHIGTDETYFALSQTTQAPTAPWKPYEGLPGVNHLGVEVDDVDALHQRLAAGGYRESTVPNSHPHRKRIYFYDPAGNDWEFIQYLSDDPAERHDYETPDR